MTLKYSAVRKATWWLTIDFLESAVCSIVDVVVEHFANVTAYLTKITKPFVMWRELLFLPLLSITYLVSLNSSLFFQTNA